MRRVVERRGSTTAQAGPVRAVINEQIAVGHRPQRPAG
jgi:hypothetical protein